MATNDIGVISVKGVEYKVADTDLRDKVKNMTAVTAFKVVNELPTTDINTAVIYLVSKPTEKSDDNYDEYVYLRDAQKWEMIGNTQIDLSDYVTETMMSTELASKQDNITTDTDYNVCQYKLNDNVLYIKSIEV